MNYQRFFGPALILVAALGVAALLGVPVLAYLPVGVAALACPLMMVFMMRGHGGHGGHGGGGHGGGGEHAHEQPAPGREGGPR